MNPNANIYPPFGTMSTQDAAQARPSFGELLGQTTHQWHGYIANREEHTATFMEIFQSGHLGQDQDMGADFDYPTTPEDELELVRVLYNAMVDFSDPFEQRDGKKSFQVERLKTVSDIEMEYVAWNVVISVVNLYNGYHTFNSCNENWKYSKFGTFGARFRAVVDACREYKSIVYNLFAPNPAERLAASPWAQTGMKEANKVLNGKRAVDKQKGKEALARLQEVGELVTGPANFRGANSPAVKVEGAGHTAVKVEAAGHKVMTGRVTKT
ncbi:hypothetical protein QBC39DRAFT_362550 [Podospora conica]|nr:hypothetical protein QBC39DRAFT_362550 [Schizothecium conicum]